MVSRFPLTTLDLTRANGVQGSPKVSLPESSNSLMSSLSKLRVGIEGTDISRGRQLSHYMTYIQYNTVYMLSKQTSYKFSYSGFRVIRYVNYPIIIIKLLHNKQTNASKYSSIMTSSSNLRCDPTNRLDCIPNHTADIFLYHTADIFL